MALYLTSTPWDPKTTDPTTEVKDMSVLQNGRVKFSTLKHLFAIMQEIYQLRLTQYLHW